MHSHAFALLNTRSCSCSCGRSAPCHPPPSAFSHTTPMLSSTARVQPRFPPLTTLPNRFSIFGASGTSMSPVAVFVRSSPACVPWCAVAGCALADRCIRTSVLRPGAVFTSTLAVSAHNCAAASVRSQAPHRWLSSAAGRGLHPQCKCLATHTAPRHVPVRPTALALLPPVWIRGGRIGVAATATSPSSDSELSLLSLPLLPRS